jgi:hypothetical protein
VWLPLQPKRVLLDLLLKGSIPDMNGGAVLQVENMIHTQCELLGKIKFMRESRVLVVNIIFEFLSYLLNFSFNFLAMY